MDTSIKTNLLSTFGTVAAGLVTAASLWLVTTVNGNTQKLVRIETQLTQVLQSPYDADDAIKDFKVVDNRLTAIELKLDQLPSRQLQTSASKGN